jgi:glutamate carboxypeptidase
MGMIQGMPYRKEGNRISGPGILDMKAGVMLGLTAIQILRELKVLSRQVKLLLHSDEEIGSPVSRAVTENVARQCGAVYVLEPAQGRQGAYKRARKGVGQYRLEVSGVAAHSGVDFPAGHSAILELACQIERISGLTNSRPGITVNSGVIGGGTRRNVVAASAWAEIDVRTSTLRDAARIDRALRGLRAVDKGCKLRISGGVNRPPMERTKGTAALFRRAQNLASALDFALEEASTGGGSDGNFTSAQGIPTLDGTGAVGAGAHAAHEHIPAEHLAPLTALLAAMMLPT